MLSVYGTQDVEEVFWDVAMNRTQQSPVVHGFEGASSSPLSAGETDMTLPEDHAVIPQNSNQALTAGSAAREAVSIRPLQQPFPNTLMPSSANEMSRATSQVTVIGVVFTNSCYIVLPPPLLHSICRLHRPYMRLQRSIHI